MATTNSDKPPKLIAVAVRALTQRISDEESNTLLEITLSNDRTLLIDDWGIMDLRDMAENQNTDAVYGYVDWSEFLVLLDEQRVITKN